MTTLTPTYKNHRFPPRIINHAIWLHFRFSLSYRDVEELLFKRGIMVIYEAIRKWCGNSANRMPISCDVVGRRAFDRLTRISFTP
jgi:transposase-like protein